MRKEYELGELKVKRQGPLPAFRNAAEKPMMETPTMTTRPPRILLAISSVILALGGLVHTAAFPKAAAVATSSNLPAFYAKTLQGLWLIDSATLFGLAVVFGLIALRPALAAGSLVMVLALVPAAIAVLLYTFIGMFMPAHVLSVAAVLAFTAGALRARG